MNSLSQNWYDDDRGIHSVADPHKSFPDALLGAIKHEIRRAKRDGVCSMSAFQVVPAPRVGGPRGTNAAWAYRQFFREAIDRLGKDRAFVTGTL